MIFPHETHVDVQSIDEALKIMFDDKRPAELRIKLVEPGKYPQVARVQYDGDKYWTSTMVFLPFYRLEQSSVKEIFDDIKNQIKYKLSQLVTEKTTIHVSYAQTRRKSVSWTSSTASSQSCKRFPWWSGVHEQLRQLCKKDSYGLTKKHFRSQLSCACHPRYP